MNKVKLLPLFAVILLFLTCVGCTSNFPDPSNGETLPMVPSTQDTSNYDGTFQQLTNGDSFYTPSTDHVVTDSECSAFYYNNLLLVFTTSNLTEQEQNVIAQGVSGEVVGAVSGGLHAFQILVPDTPYSELQALADRLMQNASVLYACCEYPVQIMNASESGGQWNPDGTEQDLGNESAPEGLDWWAEAIGAYTAWEYTAPCQPVRVGIVDNGFLADHEDLQGQITFVTNDGCNTPANHGTEVAGIIGAKDNAVGIRGVADTAQLYCADLWPLDSPDSYHTMLEYVAVINFMAQSDVRVVNNSWGCLLPSEEDWVNIWGGHGDSYENWLNQRLNQDLIPTAEFSIVLISQLLCSDYGDMLLVQAAGNSAADARYLGFFASITEEVYNNLDASVLAKLTASGVTYEAIDTHLLIVGAAENVRDANGNYNMAYFSNFGPTVDICAPGHIIYTTMYFTGDSYGAEGGTSLAAPMVTGGAAFLWALDPELSAPEVRQILLDSAQVQAVGIDGSAGWSYPMLNVGTAVKTITEDTP